VTGTVSVAQAANITIIQVGRVAISLLESTEIADR
jgi:hypothetical protein